jgi:Lon protease-like protein
MSNEPDEPEENERETPKKPSRNILARVPYPNIRWDRRFTADWAKDNERHAAGQRAEQQRMADFYTRLTQEQEERENAEAQERFAEGQRKKQGAE